MVYSNFILLGGSGFIGKQLAFALANCGYKVLIPCRRPHRNKALLVHPNITVVEANVFDPEQLDKLCQNQDAMVNLIGILHERKRDDFRRVHVDYIKPLVDACTRHNIKRLLHISALGANQATGTSRYLRSKGEGENMLHTFGQKDLRVTSFQPSVVFGKNDQFINRFAGILRICPGFFPIACGHSKLAPVYVGDLVEKMIATIDDKSTHSKRYTVCGPEVFSLKQILELLAQAMGVILPYRGIGRQDIKAAGNGITKPAGQIVYHGQLSLITDPEYL